jgi:hypothetical protein
MPDGSRYEGFVDHPTKWWNGQLCHVLGFVPFKPQSHHVLSHSCGHIFSSPLKAKKRPSFAGRPF